MDVRGGGRCEQILHAAVGGEGRGRRRRRGVVRFVRQSRRRQLRRDRLLELIVREFERRDAASVAAQRTVPRRLLMNDARGREILRARARG